MNILNFDLAKYIFVLFLFGSNGIVASYILLNSYEIVFWRTLIAAAFLLSLFLLSRQKFTFLQHKKDALFLSERRERISNRTVQSIVRKELLKAGLDINKYSVHKLRHTAATLMYQYGNVDIRALQELLGHESISTTEIYTHVDNSQIRSAVENNPLANLK